MSFAESNSQEKWLFRRIVQKFHRSGSHVSDALPLDINVVVVSQLLPVFPAGYVLCTDKSGLIASGAHGVAYMLAVVIEGETSVRQANHA